MSLVAYIIAWAVFDILFVASQKTCNILDFGAIGDGITKNTEAISLAVRACSSDDKRINSEMQNKVLVPSGGIYLTGSFVLSSGINLFIERDAILLGSTEQEDYPLIDILPCKKFLHLDFTNIHNQPHSY